MQDRLEIARKLARRHYEVESAISRIFTICDNTNQQTAAGAPIRLLEVNEDTPASGVMPLSFGPSGEIPYPSVIIEVTPAEFEKIRRNELKLPEGWELGEELPKELAYGH